MNQTSTGKEPLLVTPDTRIIEILDRYGDVAEVMEALGVKPVGPLAVRRALGRLVTVRRAAQIHRLSLDEMLAKLRVAIARVSTEAP